MFREDGRVDFHDAAKGVVYARQGIETEGTAGSIASTGNSTDVGPE